MANFVTADDKRIYDLLQELNPGLDWSLPIDLPGKIGASRITLLQLLNLLSENGSKQDANAGATNPDNTFGDVGDFYYKIPADGSSLTLFKKVSSNSWATVFNLPIGGSASGQLYRVFLIPTGTDASNGISLVGRTNEDGDQLIPDKAVWSVYDGDSSSSQSYNKNTKTVTGLETDDNGLTVNEVEVVLIGGEPVVPTQINFTNDSGVDMIYSINNGSVQSFLVNQTIQVSPGDSLILATSSEPTDPLALRDQNGYLINTDGTSSIESTPHQWNIPLNSTTLTIESGLG